MKIKICSRCNKAKDYLKDFYFSRGKTRADCKACVIKHNSRYQKKRKAWLETSEEKREYYRNYYAENKDKFAEYRRRFKQKFPEYYREYSGKVLNQKRKGR